MLTLLPVKMRSMFLHLDDRYCSRYFVKEVFSYKSKLKMVTCKVRDHKTQSSFWRTQHSSMINDLHDRYQSVWAGTQVFFHPSTIVVQLFIEIDGCSAMYTTHFNAFRK